MAKITLKCTWRSQPYKALRQSSQYCGGTRRQIAHRLRQKTPTLGPAVGGFGFFDQWMEAETRWRNAFERYDELNYRLNSVLRDKRNLLNEDVNLKTQLARRDDDGTFTPDQWKRLANMDDKQLRQWVMAGRALARKGENSPVENAMRWVEENQIS